MLLLAMGALVAGLTGCFGWGDGSGRDSCWRGGDEFLEHGHHVFYLFRVLCLKHICHLGDDHGLSLGIREVSFRCLVRNALFDGSGCRPVPLDLFCVFVLNVHTESGEGLVGRGFGMSFSHGSVKLTTDLVS